MDRLRRQGVDIVMRPGDGRGAAYAAAKSLGIDKVVAEASREGKADAAAALNGAGRVVEIASGRVNDAPAAAAADIGVTMATGSDATMHSAGATLMRGDPVLVAGTIGMPRRACRKTRQGPFWAFVYILVAIPLASFGLLSPVMAGAAMALSSVGAVMNALSLRGWKPHPV